MRYIRESRRQLHLGNSLTYKLQCFLSKEDINPSIYNLFDYLFNFSFYINQNNKIIPLYDLRAASVILYIFPLHISYIISMLLYKYELDLYKNLTLVSKDILLPSKRIELSFLPFYSDINNNYINQLMNNYNLSELSKMLEINIKSLDKKTSLEINIRNILIENSIDIELINNYVRIISTNNRYDSIEILSNLFNFRNNTKSILGGLMYEFLQSQFSL